MSEWRKIEDMMLTNEETRSIMEKYNKSTNDTFEKFGLCGSPPHCSSLSSNFTDLVARNPVSF